MLIKNYKEGSDITIMNTLYCYPRKNEETNKWDKGSITLVYKDNVTGKKYHEYIEDPDYEFYVAKPDIQLDHNELFIEEDKVEKITVPYLELEKKIAELTGNLDFYYENIKSGNRYANKQLHFCSNVFMSDTHIEDHYRFRFAKEYQNNTNKISKAFLDIEADTRYMRGDFPELGECPINAVTVIDEANNNVFTFLLRNKNNPLIEQFEKSINKELFDRLKEFVRTSVGGYKNEIRLGLDKLNYNFLFYDECDEIMMVTDIFKYINGTQPDFVLAWNMSFDIPYIIERIKVLGYDPKTIICHPNFENKQCEYFIDERNKNEFAERGDYAIISSYSVYLDQLIHFASRRKGQSQFTSFSLDSIGAIIAKVHKLDYKDITTDLGELPYLNYEIFVFYNIMDTIVQKCIEKKVEDINYLFGKCIMNNTRYHKGHRQTVYLANRGAKEFLKDGYIIGNNANKANPKPEQKYPGAFVGDPLKVSNYSMFKTSDGQVFMVFDNLDDFDYASLYPSILREFNMAPNTQIGMIKIDEKIYENENPTNNDKYSRSGAFLEDLQSGVYLEFCKRWFNLAGYGELYEDVEEYFTKIKDPFSQLRAFTPEGLIIPISYNSSDLFNPIRFETEEEVINPIFVYKVREVKENVNAN